MQEIIIEFILGSLAGLFLGITGIAPIGFIILALDFFKIGDYRTNLGSVLFLNLFPISIGSVYEFYKNKKINFSLGITLLLSIIIGSYIGSKFVVDKKIEFSIKNIKYLTSFLSLFIGIIFYISAYYEKS